MNTPISINGGQYISAIEAAQKTGFVRDYIARLCREGKVRGTQIGKNWFVDPHSLDAFIAATERGKEERFARQSAQFRSAFDRKARALAGVPPIENATSYGSRIAALALTLFIVAGATAFVSPAARALNPARQHRHQPDPIATIDYVATDASGLTARAPAPSSSKPPP